MACEPSKLEMMIRRAKNTLLQLAYLLRLKKRPKDYTVCHAEREFVAAGYTPLDQEKEDGPNKWIQENVLELLEVFARQGHSGFSAPYAIETFRKLALHEPLVPLSGADDEWNEVGDGVFQILNGQQPQRVQRENAQNQSGRSGTCRSPGPQGRV